MAREFANIVDPGDLVKLLELGKVLATYEENTRDFLFPDPKLTHGRRGLEREILMKRSPSFTSIRSLSYVLSNQADMNWVLHSTLNGKMHSKVPKKSPPPAGKGRQSSAVKSYEQPTIASKSRSPSPYTKRRMCELSEEARQRLAHLNLGPHEFRRDTDKPPFVIRRVGIRSKIGQPSPGAKLHPWCSLRESTVEAWPKAPRAWNIALHDMKIGIENSKAQTSALFHFTSFVDLDGEENLHHGMWAKSISGKGLDSSAVCKEDVSPDPPNRESHSAASLEHSAPPAAQEPSPRGTSPSSVLNRSSLRERFSTGWPSPANGDEIHKRVKNILRTHSARQRLIFDDLPQTREPSDNVPLTMSELQSSPRVQQNAPVHLDNGSKSTEGHSAHMCPPLPECPTSFTLVEFPSCFKAEWSLWSQGALCVSEQDRSPQ
ncbi:hypothetical protein IHE44_0015075 [Lamprotornis superbus]|uniref:Spermatogenesis-associated protein 6 N-terminal domain-containing protein n=1 Tax=Lamprotornis superbus TaxID=245042 RepID=A0A835NSK5_9PASS|nr:hypothetical protein IHE44_0015075 [Lamprotornis superbus]